MANCEASVYCATLLLTRKVFELCMLNAHCRKVPVILPCNSRGWELSTRTVSFLLCLIKRMLCLLIFTTFASCKHRTFPHMLFYVRFQVTYLSKSLQLKYFYVPEALISKQGGGGWGAGMSGTK
jgi:hypothetical protein